MATYTVELRTILKNNVEIFDFNYPIFDESYRRVFEDKFKAHFYFREIGVETVARFKFNLREMLNRIMPYYNKMYISQGLEQRILDNYDVTETFERNRSGSRTGVNESVNKNMFSNTGRKRVDINDIDYVSNINKEIINNTSNINDDDSENWTRKMTGNIGVQTDAYAVTQYEQSLKNIDNMVFEELEILFMGVF